jgi:hypothetical protein
MTTKYKMSLDDFEAEHAAIGKHLAAARDSVTEGGRYKLPLNKIRECHSRMGDMIVDAYASMTNANAGGADTMNPRGANSGPRGMDSMPDLNRLAPGASNLGENMNRLLPNRR